jgi:hypothetical protein
MVSAAGASTNVRTKATVAAYVKLIRLSIFTIEFSLNYGIVVVLIGERLGRDIMAIGQYRIADK